MLTKDQMVDLLQDECPRLAAEYGVKRIGVFGSHAKGVADEASDIDIVVEFARPIGFKFVELAEYLERLLGNKVDMLTHAGIRGIRVPHIAKDIEENIVYVGESR